MQSNFLKFKMSPGQCFHKISYWKYILHKGFAEIAEDRSIWKVFSNYKVKIIITKTFSHYCKCHFLTVPYNPNKTSHLQQKF